MINLSEVLSIYKEEQVDLFLKKYTGINLNERNLTFEKIKKHYKFLGNNPSNGSNVGQLTTGEKGLIERITNAIDAVVENEKIKKGIITARNHQAITEKAFPKYFSNMIDVLNQNVDKSHAKDAENMVVLAVNDGSKSNKPTFDIIDKGTGLLGNEFESTILSINNGNKLSRDKEYTIGAFGQGGSTSLAFTYATIILSKKNDRYFFTIIKSVELLDNKNISYVYFTVDGKIPELNIGDSSLLINYLNDFINGASSGTMIRMIEAEISKRFRDNEVTKPGMLGDYLNTELFNVALPVKVIENREQFSHNVHVQNRNIYGSLLKLKTSKYVKKDYSGTLNIEHNNRTYNIDYYILLPQEEEKWGNEIECKKVFEQFNVYYDPIIYTVNGQTITTDRYIKINNAGLNFLRFRLLIVINLDILGSEKYRFFTTDRARIVHSDLTRGFLDKVIRILAKTENLVKINEIIAEKSISTSINQELLDEVAKQVKSDYGKFLKNGSLVSHKSGFSYKENEEEVFEDKILEMRISSKQIQFYKNENVVFILNTQAQKQVNQQALIYMYINGKSYYDYQRNYMNGRIQNIINPGSLSPGSYTVEFEYFKDDRSFLKSEKVNFEVLNELLNEDKNKQASKILDLKIVIVDESSLICDISRDIINKKVDIRICLSMDQLMSEIYGISTSSDELASIKNKIIKPLVLFSLFYADNYEKISEDDQKNRLVLSFLKAYLGAIESKILNVT